MLASGYTMLYTAALTYDRKELANFARESLSRIAQLITESSQVIPFVVADELSGEDQNATDIAEKALEETQKAWDVKNTMIEA
jgi:predicted metal-dependent RNase